MVLDASKAVLLENSTIMNLIRTIRALPKLWLCLNDVLAWADGVILAFLALVGSEVLGVFARRALEAFKITHSNFSRLALPRLDIDIKHQLILQLPIDSGLHYIKRSNLRAK